MTATKTPSRDRRGSEASESEDALIARRPGDGRDRAYVVESGTSVWAVICSLHRTGWDIAEAGADYGLSESGVRAAIDYYEQNRAFIDAFILLNSDENYA